MKKGIIITFFILGVFAPLFNFLPPSPNYGGCFNDVFILFGVPVPFISIITACHTCCEEGTRYPQLQLNLHALPIILIVLLIDLIFAFIVYSVVNSLYSKLKKSKN
jgi:hypothetical protein